VDPIKKEIVLTETNLLILCCNIQILSVYYDTTRVFNKVTPFQCAKLTIETNQTPGTYFVSKLIGLFKEQYKIVKFNEVIHQQDTLFRI
jgi:hypothetical protein